MRFLVAVSLAVLFFSQMPMSALASERTKDEVFASLQGAISQVKERYSERPVNEREVVEDVRKTINRLDDKLIADQVSKTYLDSLFNDSNVLYEAAKIIDFSISFKKIQAVADDLSAKWKSLNADLAFINATWDGMLKVSVETVRGGKPIGNLLVRMNMEGVPDQSPPFVSFPGLTSPSDGSVPPGKYLVFIVGANEKVVAHQSATVTGTQQSVIKIQVLVP